MEEKHTCWIRHGQAMHKRRIKDLGSGPLSGWWCHLSRQERLDKWAALGWEVLFWTFKGRHPYGATGTKLEFWAGSGCRNQPKSHLHTDDM